MEWRVRYSTRVQWCRRETSYYTYIPPVLLTVLGEKKIISFRFIDNHNSILTYSIDPSDNCLGSKHFGIYFYFQYPQ